ncbi:MAG: ABC transporter ATP-binding protein [Salibacteraceae bacterium]
MEKTPKTGFRRLLQLLGQQTWMVVLAIVLAVVNAGLSLVPYVLVVYILDTLLTPPLQLAKVETYLLLAIGAAVVGYACMYLSGLLSHIAAFSLLHDLRKQIAVRLGLLPMGFITGFNSGALKKIVIDDVERIESFVAHQVPDFVKGLALPVFTIGYLFTVDWRLAAISFVPLVVVAVWLPLIFSSSYTKKMMGRYHASQEQMNSGIVEFVRALPVMKIFGQTAEQFHQYSGAVNEYAEMSKKWTRKSGPPFAVFMSFMSNATLPVLAVGTWLYGLQDLSLSTFVLFLILGVGYIKPLFALSNMGMQLMLINKGVGRMDEVLQAPIQPKGTEANLPTDWSLTFENLGFAYKEGHPVLENISFTIPEKRVTALVGPSGAGKSTAARLVGRFWDANQGCIRLGDVPLNELPLPYLMENVAFVFQDSFLFEDSVLENIRMGMNRSEEEVEQAARAARCHEFIERLPHGYHTRVGEHGVHFSGGEQQRIQLARAILKDAPLLILDEATAFSDAENEYLIQEAVGQLIQDKTVIVIAHRLSTITDVDQMVLFDAGKIVGKGTHQELLDQNTLYQTMWDAHQRAKDFEIGPSVSLQNAQP